PSGHTAPVGRSPPHHRPRQNRSAQENGAVNRRMHCALAGQVRRDPERTETSELPRSGCYTILAGTDVTSGRAAGSPSVSPSARAFHEDLTPPGRKGRTRPARDPDRVRVLFGGADA